MSVFAFLRRANLFRDLAEPHLLGLGPWLRERRLKEGEVLFREGDFGREMFVIVSGSVVISKAFRGRPEQVIARVVDGEHFGEMNLFDRAPRSATVRADTDTVLFSLDHDNLRECVKASPRATAALFYALAQLYIQRLLASGGLAIQVLRQALGASGPMPTESRRETSLDRALRSTPVHATTDTVLLWLDRDDHRVSVEVSPAVAAAFFYMFVHVLIQWLRAPG